MLFGFNFEYVTAFGAIFEFVTALVPMSELFTSPFLMSWDGIDSSIMSDDPIVFAAYALSSGEAIKAPAMNAATIIPPIFRLIMLSSQKWRL